jgi:hypothetical protein
MAGARRLVSDLGKYGSSVSQCQISVGFWQVYKIVRIQAKSLHCLNTHVPYRVTAKWRAVIVPLKRHGGPNKRSIFQLILLDFLLLFEICPK